MIEGLRDFFDLLRRNGLRVSIAEALDATSALAAVGLGEPAVGRAALEATLVKRAGDRATFRELFDLYFHQRVDPGGAPTDAPLVAALRARGFTEEEIERLLAAIATDAASLTLPARMALGIRRADLGLLLQLAGIRLDLLGLAGPLQVGFVTQRLLADLGVLSAEAEARALAARLAIRLDGSRASALTAALEESFRALRGLVRRVIEDEGARRERKLAADARSPSLLDHPIAQLSSEEITAVRSEVRRLARRLRAQRARRRSGRRRGRLDLRRTARASLTTGGAPVRLIRRMRPPERPELVALVDISDSMRTVARFFLELVYLLQEEFSRVRTFAFVSSVGETTDLFRRYEIGEAISRAYAGAVVDVHANSNCGRALALFCERHIEAVSPRTTLLVISDARNNYLPANASSLATLRARAKRLWWLNPESPASWGLGDGVMRDYAPHCDRVEVIYSVSSLHRVIDALAG